MAPLTLMWARRGGAGPLDAGPCRLQALPLSVGQPGSLSWIHEVGAMTTGSLRLFSASSVTGTQRGFGLSTLDFKVPGKDGDRSRQCHVKTPWTNHDGQKNGIS